MPDFRARIATLRGIKGELYATFGEIAGETRQPKSGDPYKEGYIRTVMSNSNPPTGNLTPVLDEVERALSVIRTRRESVAA